MTTANIQTIETLVKTINNIMQSEWNTQTGFTALVEKLQKYDNVFQSFDNEVFICGETYDFCLEVEDQTIDFTIYQAYADIKKFTLEY